MSHAVSIPSDVDLSTELEVVRALIARQLDLDPARVTPRTRLKHDLGLSLLGLAVLALEVEDVTGVLIPFDAFTKAPTVQDFALALRLHRRRDARICE